MSILLDKKELKKAAKEVTTIKLQEIIETLNGVMAERQKEIEVLQQIKDLAKSHGFTIEQLGYKLDQDSTNATVTESTATAKRPIKPKFKTVNKESQFFYVKDGKLQHLKAHTMKQGLIDQGINPVPYHKVDKQYLSEIDALLAEAVTQATDNYNSKVAVWNAWAQENDEEILQVRAE